MVVNGSEQASFLFLIVRGSGSFPFTSLRLVRAAARAACRAWEPGRAREFDVKFVQRRVYEFNAFSAIVVNRIEQMLPCFPCSDDSPGQDVQGDGKIFGRGRARARGEVNSTTVVCTCANIHQSIYAESDLTTHA